MDRGDAPARGMTAPVVIIAGSDPSGGAGLSRDIDTLARLDGTARPVVTAVTAQTDGAVKRIACLPPAMVTAQLDAALTGCPPGAVKIGMLGSAAIAEAVAGRLAAEGAPIVLDPVLAASSGATLLDRAGREATIRTLFPNTYLLTPNLPEAAALTGRPAAKDADGIACQAEMLLALGPRFVLIKGGHASGEAAVDRLFSVHGLVASLNAPRRSGTRRGTGCMLATAIAAFLARGRDAADACRAAKEVVWREL